MASTASNGLPLQGAVLLVDKPSGWTSHDIVARARRLLGTRKIGHAGTLDPLATGLLLLGVGPATRLLTHMVGLDKEYEATIRLGQTTTTEDSEGEVTGTASPEAVRELATTPERLRAAAGVLTGEIEQVPSSVSAIKVDGRRAYDLVRAGEQVQLKARAVTIHGFTLGEPQLCELPGGEAVLDVPARVQCSSGTYIRALARDLGESLGVGAHLTQLRRTRVCSQTANFSVQEALPGEVLERHAALVTRGELAPADAWCQLAAHLLQPADVACRLFPSVRLAAPQALALSQGKTVDVDGARPGLVAAVSPAGRLVGIARASSSKLRAVTNFPVPAGWSGAE